MIKYYLEVIINFEYFMLVGTQSEDLNTVLKFRDNYLKSTGISTSGIRIIKVEDEKKSVVDVQ